MQTLFALLEALRPKQWTKNGILFAALIFSHNLMKLDLTLRVCLAVGCFCLLSSIGYLFNDLLDIEADRGHPKKQNRPLASGRLPVSVAVAFMGVCSISMLSLSFWLSFSFGVTAAAYLGLTFAYTLVLKHIVIVDVMALATGFILRAVAGATVIDVFISPWFLICIAFGSLFLALNKRLSELLLLEKSAGKFRKNLDDYSISLLERMLNMVTASTIMSYALYTFDAGAHPEKPRFLMLTIPFVLYGVFRYQYLVSREGDGGAPELTLLRDRPLQATILLWVGTIIIVLHAL